MKIIEDVNMLDYDWSGCRSRSRAERRFKRGIPQRVKITPKREVYHLLPDTYIMHPASARRFREEIGAKMAAAAEFDRALRALGLLQ